MLGPPLQALAALLACTTVTFPGIVQAMPLADALASSTAASNQPLPSSSTVRVSSFTGPLLKETLGDLSILQHSGKYYAFASHIGLHGGEFKNVPTAVSSDLTKGWQPGPDAMPHNVGNWTVDPSGKQSLLWNPDVSQLDDGRFIMYYSAKGKNDGKNDERCIGIAYSSTPLGPYTPTEKPFYCPPAGGAIGVDGIQLDGKRWVLWKAGSDVPKGSHVALWQVDSATGSKPQTAQPCLITDENPDQPGYEGPALTKMPNGKYLLLHTKGIWHINYTIHWATANSICDKYKEGGLLMGSGDTSNGDVVYRPGGPDFLGQSNKQIFFFADPDNDDSKKRNMYYGELEYGKDGSVAVKVV